MEFAYRKKANMDLSVKKYFLTLIALWMLFSLAACKTSSLDEVTVTMEEAKAISLKFQGENKSKPSRGFGKDIQRLIELYQDKNIDYESYSVPSIKHTPKSVAELARSIQDRNAGTKNSKYGPGPWLRRMAWAEFISGNISNALEIINHVEHLNPNLYRGTIASAMAEKAIFLAELGNFRKAETYQSIAINMKNRSSGATEFHQYYIVLGKAMMAFARGEMQTARFFLYKALEHYDNVKYTSAGSYNLVRHHHEVYLKANIARTLLALGRFPEAELMIREVISSYTGQNLMPHLLMVLSQVYSAQNRYEDAMIISRTALNYILQGIYNSSRYADALVRAQVRESLARNLLALGRWYEALEQFNFIEKEMSTDPDAFDRRFNRSPDWGLALLMTNHSKDALKRFDLALSHKQQHFSSDHNEVLEIKALRAMALGAGNQIDAALEAFEQVLPKLMTMWQKQGAGNKSVGIPRFKLELIIEAYLDLLDESGQYKKIEAALPFAGMLHARVVGQALAASAARSFVSDPKLAELIRQRQDMGLHLSAVQNRINEVLMQSDNHQDNKVKELLQTDIDELRGSINVMDKEIKDRFPRYSTIVNPGEMSVSDIRVNLNKDEAYIFIFPGYSKTFVWAFQGKGNLAFKKVSMGRQELTAIVADLRKALSPKSVTGFDDIPDFDTMLAHDLYKQILQPVEGGWESAKNLLVVSPGPLGQLPLSLLPTAEPSYSFDKELLFAGYRKVAWLARTHSITILPSAAALITLRSLPDGGDKRLAFAGFGDPLFRPIESDTDLTENAESSIVLTNRGGPVHIRGVRVIKENNIDDKKSVSIKLNQLSRLRETADEIRALAIAVGANLQRDVFLGPRASETTVKSMNLKNRRIIVFATHGLIPGDLDGLNEPALALSAPEVTNTKEDGLLTMGEIMALRLNADWVVLSACNTAAGDGAGAESVSGLGQAFFYAGTRALLVTNWPVETMSAKLLTSNLFRLQAQYPGLNRAEAFRRAMISLIDEPVGKGFTYAHPIFWAPFMIVGDGSENTKTVN